MTIRAVFFDIDGTLFSHTTNAIPLSALEAVEALRKKGILAIISSGRSYQEIQELPVIQYPFDGYILLNGQMILNEQFEVIAEDAITGKDKEKLIEVFNEKEIPLLLVEKDRMYLNFYDERVKKTQSAIATAVPPLGEYEGDDIFLASAFLTREERIQLMSRFETLKAVSWHQNGIDILPKHSGKMKGILTYLEKTGIEKDEIMAFGDAENDIDMLEYAGIGIAMGNGGEDVKAAADFVTRDIDDDGIAYALQHFGLID